MEGEREKEGKKERDKRLWSACTAPLGERVEEQIGIGKQKVREKRCAISPFLCVLLVDECFFTFLDFV